MVQVNHLESNQSPENTGRSVRDNCQLNFNEIMAGQNYAAFNNRGDLNANNASVPNLQIVDSGRQYSSDTQEAARLSGVLHRGSLLQELDSAKTGKQDGKISKNDLDIYLRMHPENNAQTRAVAEMREAWDNRNHPNHGAVQLLKKELANERQAHRDENGGKPGFREMPHFEPLP